MCTLSLQDSVCPNHSHADNKSAPTDHVWIPFIFQCSQKYNVKSACKCVQAQVEEYTSTAHRRVLSLIIYLCHNVYFTQITSQIPQHYLTSTSYRLFNHLVMLLSLIYKTRNRHKSINPSVDLYDTPEFISGAEEWKMPRDQSGLNRRVFRTWQNCPVIEVVLTFWGSCFHVVAAASPNA